MEGISEHEEVQSEGNLTKERKDKNIYEDIDSSDEDDEELKPEKKEAYKKTLF